jgi:methyl-accepting chemotaxis protein PixJ
MKIKPTEPRFDEGQNSTSLNPLQRVKKFVRDNLIRTIIVTIAGSMILTGVSTYNIWTIYNSFRSTITKQFALQNITGDLVYQDEFLTMSAKMLVSTADLQWENRYNQMVPTADALTSNG